jgi:CobQ-like glutamine amidotransferase family enzyme
VFIDTTTLAPDQTRATSEGISDDRKNELINDQITHIENNLKKALRDRPDFLIVCGHYPIYSGGTENEY